MGKRHVTVPIFVPHLGCPHDCVFCNQRAITGQSGFDLDSVPKIIEKTLSTVDPKGCEVEIAFFGGSFTGIDRDLMIHLLQIAEGYVHSGRVQAIRCSTRPDYIDDEILDILRMYGVRTIEIGVQSLSDRVLATSARGHDATCTIAAMKKIRDAGFDLVGQMMLGLPCSTLEDELACAAAICDCGAAAARIYPTAVFAGTALHRMMQNGSYTPLTVEEAVHRGAQVMEIFLDRGVKLLRVGLCESDSLYQSGGIVAGGYHPAMGELCASELYRRKITSALDTLPDNNHRKLEIRVPSGALSKAIGQNRRNRTYIEDRYSPKKLRFTEDPTLADGQIRAILSD